MASGQILVCAASVARFYNEPLRWALLLTLTELMRWQDLIPAVRAHDPMASAVWIRKPPGGDT
jgi:hypothetical protein